MPKKPPLSVFVSYSHRDQDLRERLETHLVQLKREGLIALWHDRRIHGGEPWAERISEHLKSADLVLFLVSADLLASDYCMNVEMKRALKRHNEGKARVVPIIVRPCVWEISPFGKLQALPRNGRPVVKWKNRDEAWADVANQLHTLVEELCKDEIEPLREQFRRVSTPHAGRVDLWREIPAGMFSMGSPKGEGYDDERPPHRVEITNSFRIGVVPVTNAQFAAFDPDHEPIRLRGVSKEEMQGHPVVNVSWHRAYEFCYWLAETFEWARGARLPLEEEWEYACRAGTGTCYWSGDDPKDLERVGWYGRNSRGRTHRVGEKPANPWGLYDVHGNVWEWTLSSWKSDYSGREQGFEVDRAAVGVELAATGAQRVARGGSFGDGAAAAWSAFRIHWYPRAESMNRGFRVLLPIVAQLS